MAFLKNLNNGIKSTHKSKFTLMRGYIFNDENLLESCNVVLIVEFNLFIFTFEDFLVHLDSKCLLSNILRFKLNKMA